MRTEAADSKAIIWPRECTRLPPSPSPSPRRSQSAATARNTFGLRLGRAASSPSRRAQQTASPAALAITCTAPTARSASRLFPSPTSRAAWRSPASSTPQACTYFESLCIQIRVPSAGPAQLAFYGAYHATAPTSRSTRPACPPALVRPLLLRTRAQVGPRRPTRFLASALNAPAPCVRASAVC